MKTAVSLFLIALCTSLTAATIDLSGKWGLQLDPGDQGMVSNFWLKPFDDTIVLPGTISQAGKGNPLGLTPPLERPSPENLNLKHGLTFGRSKSTFANASLQHLYQRFSYIGPAWYRRNVEIPESWTNQDVQLVLERVIWETRVWVNGEFIGARNSLTTPHRYEIGAALKPGQNEIVIRVDNRRQVAIGDPHAYTEQSQSIWNGIIGQITLTARDKLRIEGLKLRPNLARQGVEVTVETHNGAGRELTGKLSLQAQPEGFRIKELPTLELPVSVSSGEGEQKIFYPIGTNFEKWSEFNPELYRMKAAFVGDGFESKISDTFGMREFKANGRQFTINGQPTFLRGTVECCVFPKTGYPDMNGEVWRKIFSTAKAYGLNHVRFHTWCPPEVAFETADRYGIYLEVELPDWSFKIGQDPVVTDFFREEGERMIREYGNHPSWVMFTMGNELKGDYGVLGDLETHFQKVDPQLLYDSTTYPSSSRGKVPGPQDDYYISQDTACGRARGQDIFNETRPGTDTNFAHAASCINVPLISHEVGQYCIYPNLAELPKYNGVMRAVGFEAIRNDLKTKGRLDEAPVYTSDSGQLAVLLYKEEVERALRTTNQAGFQLLQLNDFPGQGTSTVGLLDAFWDSKGLIKPREFRKFCGPVVPLVLMPKRVYQNSEMFDAGVEIANFGMAPIQNATVNWKISDGNKKIGGGSFKTPFIPLGNGILLGRIRQSLLAMTNATRLKVTVAIAGTSFVNDWSIWVYPAMEKVAPISDIAIFQTTDEIFYQALHEGKRVLLLPSASTVKSPLAAQFVPVFWNPVMFPNQPGTMGAMIEAKHPVFAGFPTDDWSDWQWWELLSHSFAVNLDSVSSPVAMPFRFVDKFNRNALPAAIFEAKVDAGKLLVCTLDISSDLDNRIAARQLRRSILDYMAGDKFQPQATLNSSDLTRLFGKARQTARRNGYAKPQQNF
jgi:Glycosyl hydrolases family 2, sugar binding domain/Glycosyl hydrolases family 2